MSKESKRLYYLQNRERLLERAKAYRQEHKERINNRQKEHYARNREEILENRRKGYEALSESKKDLRKNAYEAVRSPELRRLYNITFDDFTSMLAAQGFHCICGKEFGENPENRPCVDHDHRCCPGKTSCGRCVRGLLCRACNRNVGIIENNRYLLQYIRGEKPMFLQTIIIGRLGKDPEIKATSGGITVANLSVATESPVKKDGNWEKHTEWSKVVVFGQPAEYVQQYAKKGSMILIEGKNRTRSYEKDGETKYITEVVADQVKLLDKAEGDSGGSRPSGNRQQSSSRPQQQSNRRPPQQQQRQAPPPPPQDGTEITDDDIPF